MFSPLDDLAVHQGPGLIGSGAVHPDLFERYELFAFDDEASLVVGTRVTVHPGRKIIDASVSVLRSGRQRSLHASRRAGPRDSRLSVGPITLEVVDPLRELVVTAEAPEFGLTAAVAFSATREPVVQASPSSTVFHQAGRVGLALRVDGTALADGAGLSAIRRRSWGIESPPVGGPGAPAHTLPQFFRHDLAVDLDAGLLVASADEEQDGWPRHEFAAVDGMRGRHRLTPRWLAGTRWCSGGQLDLVGRDGTTLGLGLETIGRFSMRGLGYAHPDWDEGSWHDELAVGVDALVVDELDPADVANLRMIHVVRADDGGRPHVGLLDLVAVGPHHTSGLEGFTDGA